MAGGLRKPIRRSLAQFYLTLVMALQYTGTALGQTTPMPCPANCNCILPQQTMQCVGSHVDSFPTDFPPGITDFIFDTCILVNIDSIPDAYRNATLLDIRRSQVSTIKDGAFAGLTKLTRLSLLGNQLTDIRAGMFTDMSQLTHLSLSGNRLTTLPADALTSLTALEELVLTGNRGIQLADGALDGLDSLTQVELGSCNLTSIPHNALGGVKRLSRLELSHNGLGKLDDGAFKTWPTLTLISMDSCSLTEVTSHTFDGLSRLSELNIGYNRLSSIPSDAFKAFRDNLRTLYLEHNSLQTLSVDLVPWLQLNAVFLGNNPWNCDCNLAWMQDITFQIRDNVTCAQPEALLGRSPHNVTAEMMCQESESESSVIALAIGIPIVIICTLLIGYYVYKIIQARRKREKRQEVRYSAVYKDTVESKNRPDRPVSDL